MTASFVARRWAGMGVAMMFVVAVVVVVGAACGGGSPGQDPRPDAGGSGGSSAGATGGAGAGSGGSGTPGSGGAVVVVGSGGAAAGSGGATPGTGGRAGSGGGAGAVATGGAVGSGGRAGSGGAPGTGGRAATGGAGGAGTGGAPTLPASSLAVRFANAILAQWPDPRNISGNITFEYNNGIVLHGIERVYAGTHDQRYLAYIQRYIDAFIDSNNRIIRPAEHSFDTMQPAILLPFLFQETGTAKYRAAADNMRSVYDNIPRNPERGYWHKQTYPNQMWLDSIYMGEPFLARYGAVFGSCGAFCSDTPVEQITLLATHVRDTATGLLYHGWDQSRMATWANATTGRSPEVWGRGLGWYAMALVDIIPDLPAAHPGRAQLIDLLGGIATALRATQGTNGMWYQVVDKGSRTDNWLETSGSGMFVYALKLGVARGYIDASFMTEATRGWQGLMSSQVTMDGAGRPVINGAVAGMGIQDDYANYVNKMRLSNSSHGLCAILMAASAMEGN